MKQLLNDCLLGVEHQCTHIIVVITTWTKIASSLISKVIKTILYGHWQQLMIHVARPAIVLTIHGLFT